MRTTYLDVLQNKPYTHTPLWIMRQAGRYLPEYRQVRSKFTDFMEMCRNADACAEVALQPITRYDLDASIVFSDILTIPEAMGMDLQFISGQGPVFSSPLQDKQSICNLLAPEEAMGKLEYVANAVRTTKAALQDKIPLIGFCGSPWTLAAYMIEGHGSKQFTKLRKMMYSAPSTLHLLLEKLAEISKLYLASQIQAGANALMIFDTWGGLLSAQNYPLFSLQYMDNICQYIKEKYPHIPVTFFTKGGGIWLKSIAEKSCDGAGVDWSISMHDAALKIDGKVALQGNLDPAALYGSNQSIQEAVKQIFQQKVPTARYIFNLGHGIYPDIDPDKVKVMVEAVREYGNISQKSAV
ncbi:uroporphyrinogen decarboxylase [Fangia hongkongensis]|uniref:uroporphyrinogen decarboxylase n=1 Tax=Fangia hongkongensis TaxID=270495 RepID=UPI000368D7EB|nr:uroporphyrinogen decarboxylase [Fangia hongkongensis]MBK2125273.1 uroporphyrinogen decarboxylase [Fangia hongkongensis]